MEFADWLSRHAWVGGLFGLTLFLLPFVLAMFFPEKEAPDMRRRGIDPPCRAHGYKCPMPWTYDKI